MNITVKMNSNMTIECSCFIEGNQWAVGAGEFGRMPYGFGATIVEAVADYIHELRHAKPPKQPEQPRPTAAPIMPANFPYPPEPTIPPRQTIR